MEKWRFILKYKKVNWLATISYRRAVDEKKKFTHEYV